MSTEFDSFSHSDRKRVRSENKGETEISEFGYKKTRIKTLRNEKEVDKRGASAIRESSSASAIHNIAAPPQNPQLRANNSKVSVKCNSVFPNSVEENQQVVCASVSSKKERITKRDFRIEDLTWMMSETPPDLMNVRDQQLCSALLDHIDHLTLEDMVAYFLRNEGIKEDEGKAWGPSKWSYSDDCYDCFDYYVATGCPNCGSSFELEQPYAYRLNPPTLLCLQCGHRTCPMHTIAESDSLVDRLQVHQTSDQSDSNDSSYSAAAAADDDDGVGGGRSNSSANVTPLNRHLLVEDLLESDSKPPTVLLQPVYVRGSRERYDFGQSSKEWWQARFLPRALRLEDLNRSITAITMMARFKAPTIKETCVVCDNTEAFYTTYQARSADEGMTIMYECTRCNHRRIYNN